MSDDGAPAFVDTNVLVYAFDQGDSLKQVAARRLVSTLIDRDRLRLSTQVLQELYVTLTRKVRRPCSPENALAHLEGLAAWPVVLVDYPAIRDAGWLSRDARLSFWDALIVIAAARSGSSRLYSEDLNSGQKILGVEIMNPFLKS